MISVDHASDIGPLIIPRHQGPPYSLPLRAAAASRVREGSTLTGREAMSLSANHGIDNKLEAYDSRNQSDHVE